MNHMEQALEPTGIWFKVSVAVSLCLAVGETGAQVVDAVALGLVPANFGKQCLTPMLLAIVLALIAWRRRTNPFQRGMRDLSRKGALTAAFAALFCLVSVVSGARGEVIRGLDGYLVWTQPELEHACGGSDEKSAEIVVRVAASHGTDFLWCRKGASGSPRVAALSANGEHVSLQDYAEDRECTHIHLDRAGKYHFQGCADVASSSLRPLPADAQQLSVKRLEDLGWYEQFFF